MENVLLTECSVRFYTPGQALLNGTYVYPAVKRISAIV